MSQNVWIHAQTNLLESLNKQEYEFLIQYADDNQEHVMEEWYNADYSLCSQTLRYGNSQLKYFKQHLRTSPKDYAIFHLGSLMGHIEVLEHFSYEKEQENLASKIYAKQVLSVKHLKDIIQLLEAHGIMSHSEICHSLNLKVSTLSEIMKKINSANLIISSKAGKYKLYRLTDTGRNLSRQLRSSSTNIHNTPKEPLRKTSDDNTYTTTIAPGYTVKIFDKIDNTKETFDIEALVINNESSDTSATLIGTKKNKRNYDFLDNANNY